MNWVNSYHDDSIINIVIVISIVITFIMRAGRMYVNEVVCDWSGVRESGAAAADPDRDRVMVTIRGVGEPHGVFSFDDRSLYSSVNASNTTLSLTVDRLAGTIGQYMSPSSSLADLTGCNCSKPDSCLRLSLASVDENLVGYTSSLRLFLASVDENVVESLASVDENLVGYSSSLRLFLASVDENLVGYSSSLR